MKTLRYSTIFFAAIIASALAGCGGSKNGENAETSEAAEEVIADDIVEMRADQIQLADIQLGAVEMRQVSGSIQASGIVTASPQHSASVSVPLGGFVRSCSLLPGSSVTKGQTLAVIENTEFIELQQSYLDIKNKYEFAEAEYNRHNDLYKDDVYSQQSMQQKASEYRSLKAQLRGTAQKLSVIGINPATLTEDRISASVQLAAPISGYIRTANISMGKYAAPTDVLFEIVSTDNLLLELTLFEKDASNIAIGQTVHFSINNESHEHNASIYQVGKSINGDKTYTVYAAVQQPCSKVLPGMYVQARIENTGAQVTAVPADAVVSFDNKYFIFAFEKNKEEGGKPFTEYRFVEVTKGETTDGFTEIRLPADFDLKNTKIVTKGAYNLLSAKKNAGEMAC